MPCPSPVTLVDVLGDVGGHRRGQGNTGDTDKGTDSEHTVEEADTNGQGDDTVGNVWRNRRDRGNGVVVDSEEVHDLTSALARSSILVRCKMGLDHSGIGSSQDLGEEDTAQSHAGWQVEQVVFSDPEVRPEEVFHRLTEE